MPTAGSYSERVEIQRNQPTLDSSRRKVDDWRAHCIRRARRKSTRPAMVLLPDAHRSEITSVTFCVRTDSRTSEIDSNFRLLVGGRIYNIEAAEPNDVGEIELTCRAREFQK